MNEPIESRSNAPAVEAKLAEGLTLEEAISHYSRAEFRDEITRLFGEAKDLAIHDRENRALEARHG